MSRFLGYHGKILRVDLAAQTTAVEELEEETYRIYAGGSLLAARFLLRETPPGLDPFDDGALLVFASSAIAGHRAAGLPRFSVIAKSPLTGGIGETRAEGPWGVALKHSGYDAILVTGQARSAGYLLVQDGEARLLPAGDLWGLGTDQTTARLLGRHQGGHVAAIGPAGERLVRFASIVTDGSFAAPRMGMGAVMGSKRLKAIVLSGGGPPPVAHPEEVDGITRSYVARQLMNPVTRWQYEPPGFGAWVAGATRGTYAVENYRTAIARSVAAYRPEAFLGALRWSAGGCPGCPNDCIKGFGPTNGGEAGDGHRAGDDRAMRRGGLHQEAVGALGPNLGIDDLDLVLSLNEQCLWLGLDPVSLGFVLSFAMECRERGLLGPSELGGVDLRFGNGSTVSTLVELIAQREGPGDWLAEGVKRAAERLGPGSVPYALHVKGLEIAGFDPRAMTNLGLGYATASIGPRYDICEHDIDFDPQPAWPHALDQSRTLGILRPVPAAAQMPEKVRDFRALGNLWSAADALNLCIFASAPTRIFSVEEMSTIVRAIAGWQTSSYEVMRWGERRNHLLRIYNLREGLTRADDWLPDRFFDEAIDDGPLAGAKLDREAFTNSIALYYASMGWDENGIPTEATRYDHHLEWTGGIP